MRLYKRWWYEGLLLRSYIFFNSGKGIELYIHYFSNASNMRGEVKFVIKSDSQYLFIFAISNSNVVRYEICLKFIFNAK